MIVVGIDSASRSGVAAVSGQRTGALRLLRHESVSGDDACAVGSVVQSLAHLAAIYPTGPISHLVLIEEPYLDKNVATALKLARITGRWAQACEQETHAVEFVSASAWQQGLLAGLITPKSPRAARKAAAKRWVRAEFGVDVPEDEADAICLASWALKRWRLESRRSA